MASHPFKPIFCLLWKYKRGRNHYWKHEVAGELDKEEVIEEVRDEVSEEVRDEASIYSLASLANIF